MHGRPPGDEITGHGILQRVDKLLQRVAQVLQCVAQVLQHIQMRSQRVANFWQHFCKRIQIAGIPARYRWTKIPYFLVSVGSRYPKTHLKELTYI